MDNNRLLYYILREDNKIWIAQYGGGYKTKVEVFLDGYKLGKPSGTFPYMPQITYNGAECKSDKGSERRANNLLSKLLNTDVFKEEKNISLSMEKEIQTLLSELHNAIFCLIGDVALTKKDIEIIESVIKLIR